MSSRKTIQRMSHPAYSPDIAASDCFPFGCIKRKFTKYIIPDSQSLKSAITHLIGEIGQKILIAVFETRINRLERVSEHDGE
jgi:hypothetical protein